MDNKKGQGFFFLIIALILGVTLFKQFDFQNFKFEKPLLDTVYLLTFIVAVYFYIKSCKKK